MQFQQDWPKDEKITTLSIFLRKTEKIRSTEHYGAPQKGSTIFLCHRSLGSVAMEATTTVHFPKTLKRPRNNTESTSEEM